MKVNATLAILAAVAIGYTACTSRIAEEAPEGRQDAHPAALPTTPERLQEAEFPHYVLDAWD